MVIEIVQKQRVGFGVIQATAHRDCRCIYELYSGHVEQ